MQARVEELLFGAVAALLAVVTAGLFASVAFPSAAAVLQLNQAQVRGVAACPASAEAAGARPPAARS